MLILVDKGQEAENLKKKMILINIVINKFACGEMLKKFVLQFSYVIH